MYIIEKSAGQRVRLEPVSIGQSQVSRLVKISDSEATKRNGVLMGKGFGVNEVMVSFLEPVLGGIRVMVLIRATGCLFESLE